MLVLYLSLRKVDSDLLKSVGSVHAVEEGCIGLAKKVLVLCLILRKVESDLLKSIGSVLDFEEGGFRRAKKCWFCA